MFQKSKSRDKIYSQLPKEQDPPMAKFDAKGNLITAPQALKSLYVDHYAKRLEHRSIKSNYIKNYDKKITLWQMRSERLRQTKSDDWTSKDLKDTLKSLKSNKTRGLLMSSLSPLY